MRRTAAVLVVAAISLSACSSGGSSPAAAPRSRPATSVRSTPASPVASPTPSPVKRDVGRPPVRSIKAALPGIEAFVEQERGLSFKRPVTARLLGHKAFVAKLDAGDSAPKPKQVEKVVAVLSSLGLISARSNVASAFKQAYDQGTLGFYDTKTKRLYVQGNRATPGVRAVLSHELTHALTDQWFDINRPKLDKSHQELGTGFTALIEGDAERTRKAYEAEVLSPQERTIAHHEENAGKTPHVPKVVLELIGFPYAVGPRFVRDVVARGGTAALNTAYRSPPTSSLQLLNPLRYFDHDNPVHVATPASDGTRIERGDLGVTGLLLMLENGVPRSDAPYGLLGWGGDQFAAWRAGSGRYCMRDTVVMTDQLADGAFEAAMKVWAATRPGAVHIERTGMTTTFMTCSS